MTVRGNETRSRFVNRAAGRLWSGQGRLDLPDVINFRDLQPFWSEYRSEILDFLDQRDYTPASISLVEHPKNYLATRPLARLSVQDRLIYEALAFEASEFIDPLLSKAVYNHRSKKLAVHSSWDWKAMRTEARRVLSHNKELVMAQTDIASFYEHIDIGALLMDLTSAGVPSSVATKIHSFLEGFESQCHTWGLPQGSAASGILANAYLLPIDNFIQQFNIDFLRYSDDIYLFDVNEERLRSILQHVNRALRARRLNMSATKTRIYARSEAESHLDDSRSDGILYDLTLRKPDAIKQLRLFFRDAIAESPANERNIKLSLPYLGKRSDDFAFTWAVGNLKEWHHISPRILRYMESVKGKEDELKQLLEGLLESVPTVDYPLLERNIFETSMRCGIRSPVLLSWAWRIVRDRNRTSYPREFAARYIGLLGAPNDGQLLKMEYEGEYDIDVRRALLVAMYEADYMPRGLLKRLSSHPTMLKWTARYLSRLQHPSTIPLPKF
ncbi:RNA-directed DNA polymerase [Streptomyces heilongjiangensis]|uniref:RNA-directed DNA polymerase n=1 Tax=Streptomyces heilongjiangensis TaxID=945052 RepID=A0ABW1BGQ2_9ACTN|nr:RNA-directed DNA polymerase [Streptomyces heilongjiangensis]MDC2952557.1 RNA-directed DNA polymerase [Streptomyces heilongjiangensis]